MMRDKFLQEFLLQISTQIAPRVKRWLGKRILSLNPLEIFELSCLIWTQ